MTKKRILVAPLDWGLGHASRCIPIIRYLLEKDVEVVIAGDGGPLALLRKEFPSLEFAILPGYNIVYPKGSAMMTKMFFSIPKILSGIRKEHKLFKKIISEKNIDAAISDNRFGCWSKKVKSVFMTHQLRVKTPIAANLLQRLNYRYIRHFQECWIPDEEGENNLSGELSHGFALPENAHFIGILSRLQKGESPVRYDVMAILSGPEPQRSLFEKIICAQLQQTSLRVLLVQGIMDENKKMAPRPGMTIVSHMTSTEMQEAINASALVLSRSGYSTVMDLAALGKKAIFVPTPGQTEQEYLGKFLSEKKLVYCLAQEKFNFEEAFKKSEGIGGFTEKFSSTDYRQQLDRFINSL